MVRKAEKTAQEKTYPHGRNGLLGKRHDSTVEVHRRILAFIEGYQYETGKRPSQQMIGGALGFSQRGAGKHVNTLIDEGKLLVDPDSGLYKVV